MQIEDLSFVLNDVRHLHMYLSTIGFKLMLITISIIFSLTILHCLHAYTFNFDIFINIALWLRYFIIHLLFYFYTFRFVSLRLLFSLILVFTEFLA